jgi:signal peptidase I|tara:strand:+ start:2885 stop:3622 length:738 start_codon:yes stop_codon:yes gene_type:complete
MNKKTISYIIDNIKTLLIALVIAILIRSLLIQPFYIPSSSMEPSLLVGDRIFVSKYNYGYSKHSFPFSPPVIKDRIFEDSPNRGDLVVFKTPSDNRTDYIKRLIGLPGDEIQITGGELFINNKLVKKNIKFSNQKVRCGSKNVNVNIYEEKLPNGVKYLIANNEIGSMKNTDKYIVPNDQFFFLGDNRDCSRDSRFLSSVGFVKSVNLVGKAQMIFFSNDTLNGSVLKLWNLKNSFRLKRTFKKL